MNFVQKKASPKALKALNNYYQLRDRQHNYYFSNIPLSITNPQFIQAYTDVFNLVNDMESIVKQQKIYQRYQDTFLNQFKADLIEFCRRCTQLYKKNKSMNIQEQANYIHQLLQNYKRFLNWVTRIFRVIEKGTFHSKGILLFNQGLKILKSQFIEIIYDDLFDLIIQLLQAFKQDKLNTYQPLSYIIKIIGICGFTKFRSITLKYQPSRGNFEFYSFNNQIKQNVQIPFETDNFKKRFVNPLIIYLQRHYRVVCNKIIQLSAPQYINKALFILQRQQDAADHFYNNKNVKDLVIRSIEEIVAHQKAQELFSKENTGLRAMLEKKDISNLKKLFLLMKRSANLKLLGKQYKDYIDFKGNSILDKVTPQDQKTAKKQIVIETVNEIYELYQNIQIITNQISQGNLDLQLSQNFAFQQVCNKTNKLTNFLAYYADNILRKDQNNLQANADLITKITKISKFLYSYDAFLKLYQKLLGLRILYDTFKNRQTQFAIINSLKTEAGVTALNKITCMITDVKFSQTFNEDLSNQGLKFKLQVMMLTAGSWQIPDNKTGKTLVPIQLLHAVERYETQYLLKLPGRMITWLFNYGRAFVQVAFNHSKHLLIVTNYQLLILLYLERENYRKIKISQLLSELKIDDQTAFLHSLFMLAKTGVISKEGIAGKLESKQQKISFHSDFVYKSIKVCCFHIPKHIEKSGQQNNQLMLERSYLVDAAIVKAMKSRRVMQYSQLITQVQKMCKTFKADIALIKKRIQNCQERQFLVRDQKDMNSLIYKP